MSTFRISTLSRAAVLAAALVIPTVSAFADEAFDPQQYYANVTNPHPELSGQLIRRSDVKVIANVLVPHPELLGYPEVTVASTPSTTPSK